MVLPTGGLGLTMRATVGRQVPPGGPAGSSVGFVYEVGR